MAFRKPNGKSNIIDLIVSAVDFETLGNLIYIQNCFKNLPHQRDGIEGVHVLFEESDYDFDELLALMSFLQENQVPVLSIKVGQLDELVRDYTTDQELITIGTEPPATHDYTGITHLFSRNIELQCNLGALRDIWPIVNKARQVSALARQLSLD